MEDIDKLRLEIKLFSERISDSVLKLSQRVSELESKPDVIIPETDLSPVYEQFKGVNESLSQLGQLVSTKLSSADAPIVPNIGHLATSKSLSEAIESITKSIPKDYVTAKELGRAVSSVRDDIPKGFVLKRELTATNENLTLLQQAFIESPSKKFVSDAIEAALKSRVNAVSQTKKPSELTDDAVINLIKETVTANMITKLYKG